MAAGDHYTEFRRINSGAHQRKEKFMSSENTRGGNHDQQVKAGQQGHKTASSGSSSTPQQSAGARTGSHEQQVKAGQQNHKNTK